MTETAGGAMPEATHEPIPVGAPLRGRRVGIIGGLGEMGRLFATFFQDRHYEVEISDRTTEKSNADVVRWADIVLFSVPLHETVAIMRTLLPHVRKEQLLMDVTSLKAAPVRAMLCSPASVVGLHPMFGGSIRSLVGQTLVACPVRVAPDDWLPLKRLFLEAGMRVTECSPDEHDRMMSVIQVLLHTTTMLMGRVLRELGIDIDETLRFTSPIYRLEMGLVGRMFAQSGALYAAMIQMNPHAEEILTLLQGGLEQYRQWFREEDFTAFMGDFAASARHLGDFCARGYTESSAILDYVVQRNNG